MSQSGPVHFPVGVITYSYVADGVAAAGAIEPAAGPAVNVSHFLPANYRDIIRRAFDEWERYTNIQFVEIADAGEQLGDAGTSGDIRISGHTFDGPSGVLAHAFFPPPNTGTTFDGEIHFDVDENWVDGFAGPGIDVFQVTAHEIGHALGLDHTAVANSLMNPFYSESLAGTQSDDIQGARSIYAGPATIAFSVSADDANQGLGGNQSGDGVPDAFLVRMDPGGSGDVQVFANGVLVKSAPPSILNGITILGSSDDDTLTVDSSNGLVSLPNGIRFDGGLGFDRLNLTQTGGPTRNNSRINVGANPGDGQSVIEDGVTQTVNFQNIEPVNDSTPATTFTLSSVPGIATLLDASNAINYVAGQTNGPTWGRITVDNFEPIEFTNKTSLVIDAGAGSDEINLNNPSTPTALTNITVNGGDPTASDTLIVNGITGSSDAFSITPTGTGSGTIANAGVPTVAPTVTFSGVEHLSAIAQSGEFDQISIGTAGNDTFVVTPGTAIDEATITGFVAGAGGFDFTPLSLKGFRGTWVSPTFIGAVGGTDTVFVNGTAGDDQFRFAAGVAFPGFPAITVNAHTELYFNPSATNVILRGFEGNDTFNLDFSVATNNTATAIRIEGGDSDASSDTLNFTTAAGASTTIDFATGLITSTGANDTTITGVESVNLSPPGDGSTEAYTVLNYGTPTDVKTLNLNTGDTDNNDGDTIALTTLSAAGSTLNYSQQSLSAATLTRSEGGPVISISGFNNADGNLTLTNGSGRQSAVHVIASTGIDAITVIQTAGGDTRVTDFVGSSGSKRVPFDLIQGVGDGWQTLFVEGGQGDDALTVDNSNGLVALDGGIHFDGGPGNDTLILTGTTAGVSSIYNVGPNLDQGNVVHTVGGATQQVFFNGLEPVIDLVAGPLVVNATNADNAINIGPSTTPNRGLVSVDGFETYEFANKAGLTINALAGSDTINVASINSAAALTGGITVNAGDPSGSDTLIAVSTVGGGVEDIVVTPAGEGFSQVSGIGVNSISGTGIEHLTVVGQSADNDRLRMVGSAPASGNDTLEYTPGTTPDSGTVTGFRANAAAYAFVPVDFKGFLGFLVFPHDNVATTGGVDTLIVNGTGFDDTFTVANGGPVSGGTANVFVSVNTGANQHPQVFLDATTSLVLLRGLTGNDTFTFTNTAVSTLAGTFRVEGGDSDAKTDAILYTPGPGATTTTIAADTSLITSTGANSVNFSGVELIRVTGAGADDILRVATGGGNDTARVEGGSGRDVVTSSSLPRIEFSGLSTFVLDITGGTDTATFATRNLQGAAKNGYQVESSTSDTLVIEGTDGNNDSFTAANPTGGDFLAVSDAISGVTVTNTSAASQVGRLQINTLNGDDTVRVDVSPDGPIGVPITFDGGLGRDTLIVQGTLPTTNGPEVFDAVTYTPGPAVDQGRLAYVDAGATVMLIDFRNLEPVIDTTDATTLTVNGTNASNAINYRVGRNNADTADDTTRGRVSVDSFETIDFSNKTNLVINGLAGSDTINLNNPNTPTGLTSITVNGGDPTADSDTVIVNGTTGANSFGFTPTGPASATITVGAGPTISVATTEHVTYNGQGGGDTMSLNTPLSNTIVEFTPGADANEASINLRQVAAPGVGEVLGFSYVNVNGSTATLTINDGPAGSGNGTLFDDTLVVNGTGDDDLFTVTAAGAVRIGSSPILFKTVTINTPGVDRLDLLGGDGDDTFNVPGNHPYSIFASPTVPALNIQGGNPSASDVLNFAGTGGLITIETDLQTISEAGFNPVSYTGIERLNVDVAGGAVDVNGSLDDDDFTVRPNDATGAEITKAGSNTVIQVNNTLDLEIDGDDGPGIHNRVTVVAPDNGNVITVTDANVAIAGRLPVNLSDIQSLRVEGRAGADTFNVTPSAATSIFIDGGDPIGSSPGDRLVIAGPATVNPGPENDEGSIDTAGNLPVNFDHIESITISGGGPAIINGTNGNDAITIIARDASTHAGANGVQDFTVTVNGGPEVYYQDTSSILVNALSGDDVITVRTPAPNGVVWNVQVTIDGGAPTASDKVVIETPYAGAVPNETVTYTPTGINSGLVNITSLTSLITLTDVEQLIYNGTIDDSDTLLVATANAVIVPGAHLGDGVVNPVDSSGNALLSLTYLHVPTVTVTGGTAVIQGTDEDDIIRVSALGIVTVTNELGFTNSVDVSDFDFLVINALGGDDKITIESSDLFDGDGTGITVIGGDNGNGSDFVTVLGTSGNDTIDVDLVDNEVTGVVGSPISFTGVEHLTVNSGGATTGDTISVTSLGSFTGLLDINVNTAFFAGDSLTVTGTAFDDILNFNPNSATSGQVTRTGTVTAVNYANLSGTMTVAGGTGGFDVLHVLGTEAADAFSSTATTVTRTGTVTYSSANIDRIDASGFGGSDTISLASVTVITVISGGDGNDTITGSAQADLILGGRAQDTITGGDGADEIYGDEGNDTIVGGLGVDRMHGGADFDIFTWNIGDGSDIIDGGSDGADILNFNGDGAANAFTLTPAANSTHMNTNLGAESVDTHGVEQINVNGLGGADTFTVLDLTTTEVAAVNLNLGTVATPDGVADTVTINGRTVADNILITGTGTSVLVAGLEYDVNILAASAAQGDALTVLGNDGNDIIKAAAGVESIIGITLNGGAGDDFLSADATLIGGIGDDTLEGGAGNDLLQGGAGADTYLFNGNGGTDVIDDTGATVGDRILILGTTSSDTASLSRNGAGALVVTLNGTTTTYTGPAAAAFSNASTGVDRIQVLADDGNDALTVNSTNGAIPVPISYDGAAGNDSLILTGGTATSDIYSVGPNPGQGTSTIIIGGVTQTVTFSGLEPVIDLVAGPLVVNATNASNAINYIAGPNSGTTTVVNPTALTTGLVSVDNFEPIEFANKTTLTINALAGSDTINLNNPATPEGLTSITVNGGDPTASDTVIVNGTTAANTISVTGFTRDGATVTGAQPVPVTVTTAEHLTIVGQGGDDTLTVTSPDDGAEITFTPGATVDAGSITQFGFDAGTSLLPLNYTTLGGGGSLTFDVDGGDRESGLDIRGTDNDDQFDVTATATGTVQIVKPTFGIDVTLPINTTGVVFLRLLGQNGDDIFNIPGDHPIPLGINVQGGNPSASDVINFIAPGNSPDSVIVDLQASTVTETGFGPIIYTGIEIINVDANGETLTVAATSDDDDVTVTVFGPTSGRLVSGISLLRLGEPPQTANAPVINYTDILGSLIVDLAGGEDTLAVVGNSLSQTFNINDDEAAFTIDLLGGYGPRTVAANTVEVDDGNDADDINNDIEGSVTWVNLESLQVAGLEGNDTFHVIPLAGPGTPGDPNSIPIFIDGGDPIGTSAGDRLVAFGNGNPVLREEGPERDEGGILYGNPERVSFDHIEAITIVEPTSVIIVGTNADDDISVIAVDSVSTPQHIGADGTRDFTVAVNDGIEVLYIDVGGVDPGPGITIFGELHIDGLAGDDDIVIRTPAPNGAPWSMQVEVAGGLPSDGADNEGDRLVLETPGTDSVFYTPSGSDTGTILIDENANGTFQAGDTQILIGQFFDADPPISYDSSPGGVELFEYDGEGGNDTFRIVGTAGNDTIVHTPGSGTDEGTLRVNNLLGVSYQNLGGSATLIANGGAGTTDTLVYDGTTLGDTFSVAGTTGAVDLTNSHGNRIDLGQIGIERLQLEGFAGDDIFNVAGNHPYTGGITVVGAEPSASDVLNFNGSGPAVTVELTASTVGQAGSGAVSYNGIERVNITTAAGSLTVNGTVGDDTLEVTPTGAGTGNFNASSVGAFLASHPQFTYSGLGGSAFTFNGGAAGFDILRVQGGEGADIVTSTATTITRAGGTVTLGTNLDRVEINTFGSDDSVTLTGLALPTVVDAGAGNDTVAANSTVTGALTIFGRDGNDTLTGGNSDDLIFGGFGNDVIIGGGGADQEYGEEGQDTFGNANLTPNAVADDPGADFAFGGPGFDNFVWEPGDGADQNNGGEDAADIFRFFGSAGADVFLLRQGGTPTHFNALIGAVVIDNHGIEDIVVDGQGGADSFTVNDLYATEVVSINLNLGAADAAAVDPVVVNGRNLDDNLLISTTGAGSVSIQGLRYNVNLTNAELTDTLTLNGNDGNDILKAVTGVSSVITLTLDGGTGNDFLSADGTLLGGADNDTLEGGAGNNVYDGGAGEDLLIASGGTDTLNGGADFDTFLIRGTSDNDAIDARQNAPSGVADSGYGLEYTVNGVTKTDTITQTSGGLPGVAGPRPTVEEVRIEALRGNDLIQVGVSDAYSDAIATNGVPNQSVRFHVIGDAPNASDRLLVRDDGTGDLVILRQAPDQRSGRVSVAPGATVTDGGTGLADVVYEGIERIDITPLNPITGGTGTGAGGRIVVFHADPFEFNDARVNAGELARIGQNATSPTIDPGAISPPFAANGDEDWYVFRPERTNTFQIQILWTQVLMVPSGRPGLPGNGGELALDIYDAYGNLIVSGTTAFEALNENGGVGPGGRRATTTAVFGATDDLGFPEFNTIYVRVKGAPGDQSDTDGPATTPSVAINVYDFASIGDDTPGFEELDLVGPQVTGGNITDDPRTLVDESLINIFFPKPNDGPTPLFPSLQIHFEDPPKRAPGFLYPAIDPALFEGSPGQRPAMGLFHLVGDRVGQIPIFDVLLDNEPVTLGQRARATVTLIFDIRSPIFEGGLPDDRYTLTVDDGLYDPPGNLLDGESNAEQPTEKPSLPSGNGQAGADFLARFTVDTRPEIATFGSGKSDIDLNGNGVWDPQGSGDAVNRDASFKFGLYTDVVFAGDFSSSNANSSNGFDKLGAYGKVNGVFRFLLDLTGDGRPDLNVVSNLQINGRPVAGDFDPSHPGQEIGLFDGFTWYLDTNGNNNIDSGDRRVNNGLRGYPIAGDFDGDGKTDLGAYQPDTDTFQFDLAANGFGGVDATIGFGFPGVMERPVAADMNQDGITDIGLIVPRGSLDPAHPVSADWYFLVSSGSPTPGSVSRLNHGFDQQPFSNDLFFSFGNGFSVPLVGNFDPPVGSSASPPPVLKLTPGTFTNVAVETEVTSVATNGNAGLVLRRAASGQSEYWGGLVHNINGTYTAQIRKLVNGKWTTLTSKTVAFNSGDILGFKAVGTTLTLSLNGNEIASAVDGTIRGAGRVGTYSSPASMVWLATATEVHRVPNALPYINTFDQSSGSTLGSDWDQFKGSFVAASNAMVGQSASNLATLYGVSQSNVTLDITFSNLTAVGSKAGVAARHNSLNGNMYFGQVARRSDGYYAEIWRVQAGVRTKLSSVKLAGRHETGQLQLDVIDTGLGTELTLSLDGAVVRKFTDKFTKFGQPKLAAGTVGILSSKNVAIGDFSAHS